MNPRIRRLGIAFVLLYMLLFAQLNRVQFFGAERLQEDVNNTRGLIREFGRPRGPIVTADGVLLARSLPSDGSVDFVREYPEGDLYAHIVGYQSLNVAATGLERVYNDELAGLPVEQQFTSLGDLFADRDTTATLRLSIATTFKPQPATRSASVAAVLSRSIRAPARSSHCGPTPVSIRIVWPTLTGPQPMRPTMSCSPIRLIRCWPRHIARSSSRAPRSNS